MNAPTRQIPTSVRIERMTQQLKKLPMAEKIDLLVKAKLLSPAKAASAKAKLPVN